MKGVFYTLICTVALLAACSGRTANNSGGNADNPADTGKSVITFNEYEHSFGKVKEGKKVSHTFLFENTGTGDLVIQAAMTTCGCTVSKYDRKPIAPGKGGKIEVEFDTSGRNGLQTKTVTVRSNASVPAVILKITADVTNTI